MRLKFTGLALKSALVVLALVQTLVPQAAHAQEGEARVVDEVVAQVNNDVITLSMVKREMKEAATSLQQQGKTEKEANDEVNRRQPELIASLIKEQLLLQQGKELGLSDEVEAEVNRRMLDVAQGQGIKTIEGLREAMRQSGFDYDAVRQTMRRELMKQAVFTRDVDSKVFYGLTPKEVKDYYEAHKDKFKKPESVTLSEIFLGFAGKSEAEVQAKAQQIISQARGGASFAQLAKTNSERMRDGKLTAPETGGVVGTFEVPNLRDNIADAVKGLKAGGITEPIRYDEGLQIIRVDERIVGSDVPVFNENAVREAITIDRSEKEHITYMEKLRGDAYIKISETYRAAVTPFLNSSPTPASANTSTQPPAASAEKRPDSKP